MTKKNYTDINIILDRSGSMGTVVDDTIGGFNTLLADQRKLKGKIRISLVQFDDQYEVVFKDKTPKKAPDLTTETFIPRGMTSLYDAIGKTIGGINSRYSKLTKADRPSKTVVVILTDGHENSSTEFDVSSVGKLIKEHQDDEGWEFIFIGANQDAILSAKELNINLRNAVNYSQTKEGSKALYGGISASISSYHTTGTMDVSSVNAKQEEFLKSEK